MAAIDYRKVGLKVGIEIHRQLDTKGKLFCQCHTSLAKGKSEVNFLRYLRPTQSELGVVDPAALFEFQKGLSILYQSDHETSCLVEMDEEPPHELNREAVEVCLQVAMLLKARPVDEIHVMRKIVIDGSNTCGFQRTCIVALGGGVDVDGREILMQAICLEEDAARKMGIGGQQVSYRIDRLGIPLIEVTTAPFECTPPEAEKIASTLGRTLKATGKVKRGIGTIRQDVNISIWEGALMEVKGVQELSLIHELVEYEVLRQLKLLKIRDELKNRGVTRRNLAVNPVDISTIFKDTKSSVVKKALAKGGIVMGVKLQGFASLLKVELISNVRLGTELSDRAKFFGGVGGIFHTDELPRYGMTSKEVEGIRAQLKLDSKDAAVIVADEQSKAEDALRAVLKRAEETIVGVPGETRVSHPDGTTRYMRPRPGSARLYPETDVPQIPVSQSWLEQVKANLPPLPEVLLKRLMTEHRINRKLAEQLVDSDYIPLFKKITNETTVPSSFIATALTEVMKSLARKAIPIENLTEEQIFKIFKLIDEGKTTKEMFPDIAEKLAQKGGKVDEVLQQLGLKRINAEELSALVDVQVKENLDFIKKNPDRAFNHLMKRVMGQVRGRVDSKIVSQTVREKLKKLSTP